MENRIELESRLRSPDQVPELTLDYCKGSTSIEGLTDEFVNLATLSLIGCGLTSLTGFPKLPKLWKLDLSDNKVTGGLEILNGCPMLSILSLSGNSIENLGILQELKELKNLRTLELENTAVASSKGYRKKVFELLPQLTAVDGFGKEYDDEENNDDDEDESDESEEEDYVDLSDFGGKRGAGPGSIDLVTDEEDEELSEEEFDSDDGDVGLAGIYNPNMEDDDDDVTYEEGEEEEDHDISDEELDQVDDSADDGDDDEKCQVLLSEGNVSLEAEGLGGAKKDDASASGAGAPADRKEGGVGDDENCQILLSKGNVSLELEGLGEGGAKKDGAPAAEANTASGEVDESRRGQKRKREGEVEELKTKRN